MNNPKLIYAYINNQRKTKNRIRALVNDEGELAVNKKGIANLLNEKFQEAFNKDNGEELPTFESRCETKCELSMSSFSSSKILSYLNILNKRKSCGNAGVNPFVLQSCTSSFDHSLGPIFKNSITSGKLPEAWKEAI